MTGTVAAAVMPRYHQDLRVADLRVGEVAYCPHWALKLDAEGSCYVMGDRIAKFPGRAGDDLPFSVARIQITREEGGFAVVIPDDASWHLNSLVTEDDDPATLFPVTSITTIPSVPTAAQQLRAEVEALRARLARATGDYAGSVAHVVVARRDYTRAARAFDEAERTAKIALYGQAIEGRTVTEREVRCEQILAADPTLQHLQAAVDETDDVLKAAYAGERIADQRQKALRVELEALTAIARGEFR